ncbi:hypothetical protein F5I97DRAFT_1890387 [Phlebopus sp. FC_14]|nr:hypothetical protein F5I97DRAFT_1890387 [Phlebopus sp. FC_14]
MPDALLMDTGDTAAGAPAVPLCEQSTAPADTIRITRQGKLRVWVKKALDFFEANPDKPLVLYSSPSDVSTSTIPRLLSVVEIIKREYLKGLDISSGDCQGLHQYNRLLAEQHGEVPVDGGNVRDNSLLDALEGHSHPKQSLAPYMRVTLSVREMSEDRDKKATYQAPAVRRMSKSAKARRRKKAKNLDGNIEAT